MTPGSDVDTEEHCTADPKPRWGTSFASFVTVGTQVRLWGALLAAAATLLILVPAAYGGPSIPERTALLAVTAASWAIVLGVVHTALEWSAGSREQLSVAEAPAYGRPGATGRWGVAVAVVIALVMQNWFSVGHVIAGWDIVPPEGTAWIGRLFDSWAPTGSNLGSPSAQEVNLPWAVVSQVFHLVGLSAGSAQRFWYTALFAGAGVAAFALLLLLGVRPLGSALGSLIYVFNPYSLVTNVSPVYAAASLLLPYFFAVILAAADGHLGRRAGVVLIAITTPMLGYTYLNPPLAGLMAATLFSSIPLAWALRGARAGRRAFQTAAVGGLLLVVCSLYWIVPSLRQLAAFDSSSYAPLSSWTWEEGRATVANALWLNTNWGWDQKAFYPYSGAYSGAFMSLLKYLLPAVALGSIGLVFVRRCGMSNRRRSTVLVAGALSLFFVVFSTGTNFPGRYLFNPLYRLPYGWLLREPFRFLIVTTLAFALLIGITLDVLTASRPRPSRLTAGAPREVLPRSATLVPAALFGLLLIPSFPLISGKVIPRQVTTGGQPLYAPHRVAFPAYWTTMANYLNSASSPPGSLISLPPDGSSDMVPYIWGYIGVDGFMVNMLHRRVIAPNQANYFESNWEVQQTVEDLARGLLAHDWYWVNALASSLDSPLVLVRGDLSTTQPGFPEMAPGPLLDALSHDPFAQRVRAAGPLVLFRLPRVSNGSGTTFATVSTPAPQPADLALLAPGQPLVSTPPLPGHPLVIESQNLSLWALSRAHLTTSIFEPAGWDYHLHWLRTGPSGGPALDDSLAPVGYTTSSTPVPGGAELRISIPLGSHSALLPNGNFASGEWQVAPSDCNDRGVAKPQGELRFTGAVEPHGGPAGSNALSMGAAVDTACESEALKWKSGPVLVSLWARTLQGGAPGLCLWQYPEYGCAPGPTFSSSSHWRHYQFLVNPVSGTTRLALFLYAPARSGPVLVQFSDVQAKSLTVDLQPTLVGLPRSGFSSSVLSASSESYGPGWTVPPGYRHVVVDGTRNGWLGPALLTGSNEPRYQDRPAVFAFGVSIIGAVAVVAIGLSVIGDRRRLRSKTYVPGAET